jgi:hypothetical protein
MLRIKINRKEMLRHALAMAVLMALALGQDISIDAVSDSGEKVPVYSNGKVTSGFDPTI